MRIRPGRALAAFSSLAVALVAAGAAWGASAPSSEVVLHQTIRQSDGELVRVELHLQPDAKTTPQLVLMTLGGDPYCMQLQELASRLHASRICTDYPKNGYTGVGKRADRLMDWGDPAYLAAVAKAPDLLRSQGVKIAKLALVGVSYSGFADANLVAQHPEIGASALVISDTYLDLTSRFDALPPTHETYQEIVRAIGGTAAQKPHDYVTRSPSDHLAGLAQAIRGGMAFVDVWSVGTAEKTEFKGATCDANANAKWLAQLATLAGRPVYGYVTTLRHGHALWNFGSAMMALAGIGTPARQLPATRLAFDPGKPAPAVSYC